MSDPTGQRLVTPAVHGTRTVLPIKSLLWKSNHKLAQLYIHWVLKSLPILQFTNVPTDPWPGDTAVGEDFLTGNLQPDETLQDLRHLHALGGNDARTMARQWVDDWLNQTKPRVWAVESTSLRVVHLFRHYSFYGYGADNRLQDRICLSLHQQLYWLEQQFPHQTDLSKRFLILVALIYAACGSKDYKPYLKEFLDALEQLLPKFLDDYQHPNFNVADQVTVVRRLISLRTLLNKHYHTPAWLQAHIYQGAQALQKLQLGDGRLPLLRSALHMPLKQLTLLVGSAPDKAPNDREPLFPLGFAPLKNQHGIAIVDMLEGPQATALEFSHGNQRIITSCGNRQKTNRAEDQYWQEALTSPAATSTLDKNWQAEIEVEELQPHRIVMVTRSGENLHRRVIEISEGGHLKGYDSIEGEHNGVLRFHLNPAINISMPAQKDAAVLLNLPNQALWKVETSMPMELEDSIHFDHRGEQHEAQQLILPIGKEGGAFTWIFKPA